MLDFEQVNVSWEAPFLKWEYTSQIKSRFPMFSRSERHLIDVNGVAFQSCFIAFSSDLEHTPAYLACEI